MKSRIKLIALLGLLVGFVLGSSGCTSSPYYGAPSKDFFVPAEVRAER